MKNIELIFQLEGDLVAPQNEASKKVFSKPLHSNEAKRLFMLDVTPRELSDGSVESLVDAELFGTFLKINVLKNRDTFCIEISPDDAKSVPSLASQFADADAQNNVAVTVGSRVVDISEEDLAGVTAFSRALFHEVNGALGVLNLNIEELDDFIEGLVSGNDDVSEIEEIRNRAARGVEKIKHILSTTRASLMESCKEKGVETTPSSSANH
jgi:hypothetical protein